MEQNEIIEGNKLIAEFMGGHDNGLGHWYGITHIQTSADGRKNIRGGYVTLSHLKYRTNWEQQIPVYSKAFYEIEDSPYPFSHSASAQEMNEAYMEAIRNNDPAAGFSILVQIIKFINKLNTKE